MLIYRFMSVVYADVKLDFKVRKDYSKYSLYSQSFERDTISIYFLKVK